MSDVSFGVHEQGARLVRAQEETRECIAERDKLLSEARKLGRDRRLAPALAVTSVTGGPLGSAAFIARMVRCVQSAAER